MQKSDLQLNWTVIGHNKQKQFLKNALARGQVAHALLFAGPQGVGKTALALEFAKILRCSHPTLRPCDECFSCRQEMSVNPDFFLLDDASEIKIEKIRTLQNNFSFKSSSGSPKVAVIAGAELMNQEAANALLKFLEEPADGTYIILTVSKVGLLPRTIVSRAQKLVFTHATGEDWSSFFSLTDSAKNDEQKLELGCFGRIGLAKKILEAGEFSQNFKNSAGWLQTLEKQDLSKRLQFSAFLSGMETEDLSRTLDWWLMILESNLSKTRDPRAMLKTGRSLKAVIAAQANLRANINKKLLLDELVLTA